MSSTLDNLHKRIADLESWKTKIGGQASGLQRLLDDVAQLLDAARKELGALGISVPGINAPPTPPGANPPPPTEGEPK